MFWAGAATYATKLPLMPVTLVYTLFIDGKPRYRLAMPAGAIEPETWPIPRNTKGLALDVTLQSPNKGVHVVNAPPLAYPV
jgi:hypothetical protein